MWGWIDRVAWLGAAHAGRERGWTSSSFVEDPRSVTLVANPPNTSKWLGRIFPSRGASRDAGTLHGIAPTPLNRSHRLTASISPYSIYRHRREGPPGRTWANVGVSTSPFHPSSHRGATHYAAATTTASARAGGAPDRRVRGGPHRMVIVLLVLLARRRRDAACGEQQLQPEQEEPVGRGRAAGDAGLAGGLSIPIRRCRHQRGLAKCVRTIHARGV